MKVLDAECGLVTNLEALQNAQADVRELAAERGHAQGLSRAEAEALRCVRFWFFMGHYTHTHTLV
jgi:hypothetical protein